MCTSCWITYGAPKIKNSRTKHAAELIAAVYEWSCVGGNAHVVIDDFNLETHNIKYCIQYNKDNPRESDADNPGAEQAVTDECLQALLALTIDERASALALHDEMFGARTKWWKRQGYVPDFRPTIAQGEGKSSEAE